MRVIIDGVQFEPVLKRRSYLDEKQWDLLAHAERPLYTSGSGANAYTDVMGRTDDDGWVYSIWEHCEMSMDGMGDLDNVSGDHRDMRVAQRVARVLAMMSFGPEFLLR